jgi:hypothetical protein
MGQSLLEIAMQSSRQTDAAFSVSETRKVPLSIELQSMFAWNQDPRVRPPVESQGLGLERPSPHKSESDSESEGVTAMRSVEVDSGGPSPERTTALEEARIGPNHRPAQLR